MIMGLAAISFSAYALWKWNDTFYKGIAIPLIMIGIVQLVVGGSVYFRTDNQVLRLEQLYQANAAEFTKAETPRMQVVMKNFSIYKKIEIAFVVIGLLLIVFASARPFWLGLGAGMLLQGAVMLTLDIFAENRGVEYLKHIIGDQSL